MNSLREYFRVINIVFCKLHFVSTEIVVTVVAELNCSITGSFEGITIKDKTHTALSYRMDTVLNYIENPEKTTHRPEEAPDANAAMKHIRDVLGYACNEDKTDKMMYVTGVNCDPDTALEEFIEVKQRWHKEGGRLAYHGYQSFLEGPGEITAEEAHEIGVELSITFSR